MKRYYPIAVTLLLLSCQKQYTGYCISGSNPSEYQVLKFVEEAATKNQAEKQVEKVLNEKFPTNGQWSCEVDD
ncbi:MAG: hypothetical protein ACO1O6_09000 [Bacteroidota bacterium]